MAELMSTMATVTVMAWSFWIKALNICPTETVSISAVERSFTLTQVRTVQITKITDTIRLNHLKPRISTSLAVAPAAPRACTPIMVTTVMMALPTPAQDRARVVRPSRSLPPSVKAGIMDQ